LSKKKKTKKEVKVKITAAKGRPMLHWVGKTPLTTLPVFPAQHIETFDPVKAGNISQNMLFHGDNKEVLAFLLANGYRDKVDLIYIDPPFNTGVDYVRKINLRGVKTEKIQGEKYSYTEQVQYAANWHVDYFMQFLYERLQIAKELLSNNKGIIFIRIDVHFASHLKLLCDEVFGHDSFQNQIVVNIIKKNVTDKGRRTIPHAVDFLLVYFKGNDAEYVNILKKLGKTKPGYWHGMESQGFSGPRKAIIEGKTYYPSPGTHFKFPPNQLDEMYKNSRIRVNPSTGVPEYWVEEKDYLHLDTNWTDIPGYTFTTGYPTENSEKLLNRVIEIGSKPGDLVCDFFIGSGTTAAAAQRLGRRWIGCDINKGAIQTTSKRLQNIINKQIKETKKKQPQLFFDYDGETEFQGPLVEVDPPVSAFAFSVWRVNDYDLQIQHNEVVNLACQHIGIERKKTDSFFDGILGKKLVKIIPFNHPLSPVDLEEIKKELDVRPDEDRAITVVCLGMELAAKAWIDEWNRLRKGKNAVNRIDVIELRSDAKYGGFIKHEPAKAKVKFARKKDTVTVAIEDFISPTIIKRLQQQAGLLKPKINDWRSMVDCVMIDANYDGKVFNICLSDVPEKKNDLVEGHYELADIPKNSNIAVKVIDMLGEEVLITKKV